MFRHEQRDKAKKTSTGKGNGEEVFSGVPIVHQLDQYHERVTGDPEPEGYTNYFNRCEVLKKILPLCEPKERVSLVSVKGDSEMLCT